MSLYRLLRERGRAASDYYAGRPDYFRLTPASLTLLQGVRPLVEAHCRGRVLDAGAGRGAYRELLQTHADAYVGMDVAGGTAAVAGDVQRLPFADATFDTVFCSQVLEHVPEPRLALAEFHRVLKDGGYLILTVPHISWLHNEPHDYYRFTRHGLAFLLVKAGFATPAILPAGGLFSLLGHIASTLWMNLLSGIPVLRPWVRRLNSLWVKLVARLDGAMEKRKIFALNYVCSARKEERNPSDEEA